jgi:hypothetical protein
MIVTGQRSGFLGPDGQPLIPPADPANEERVARDASGVSARCSATFKPWKVARTVVSMNPKFGIVVRADVVVPPDSKPSFRNICWRLRGADGKEQYATVTQPFEMFDPKESVQPLSP